MSREVFLGIDTSCYTTSVALLAADGSFVDEARIILAVKPGCRGLQQSEMVFQHTRNLPLLLEKILQGKDYHLLGIGASARPRPLEDSYMPAFLAGAGVARSLAAATGARLSLISHQENHLEAGAWSAGGPQAGKFLLLHASGGTTDLLLARRTDAERYEIKEVGTSIDLHAGQFVDRVGVALGLQFPAGAALEKLAAQASEAGGEASMAELPVAVRKFQLSFSGPCSAALRKLEEGASPAALAMGVQYALAESFARVLRNAAAEFQVRDVLLVGGVAANGFIRKHVEDKLAKARFAARLWVPEPRFSSDNAVGCAAFAWRTHELDKK